MSGRLERLVERLALRPGDRTAPTRRARPWLAPRRRLIAEYDGPAERESPA